MRRNRRPRTRVFQIFALALTACLVAGALSVSSASALSFRPSSPSETAFTQSSGGEATANDAKSHYIWCEGESGGISEFEDEVRGTATLALRGCEGIIYHSKCTSSGAEKGEIRTAPLSMKLVELPGGGIGMLFEPVSGSLFAEFSCGGFDVKWSGGVIGGVTDPGYETQASSFDLSLVASGESQQYTETADGQEAHLEDSVTGSAPTPMGLNADIVMSLPGDTYEFSTEGPEKAETPYLKRSNGFPAETLWLGEGTSTLRSADGESYVKCSAEVEVVEGELITPVGGSGEFTNSTEGEVELTFHGCATVLGLQCTTPGQETGTLKTERLPISLSYRADGSPGLYIGQNESSGKFVEFSCPLAGKTVVAGGVEGSVVSPEVEGDRGFFGIEISEESGLEATWWGGVALPTTLNNDSRISSLMSVELREAKPF